MLKSNKRASARQLVESLKRPEGISPCLWIKVQMLLREIAAHYPKAYPSQERLAALLGCNVRSIRRYVTAAQTHGLLLVMADAGMKGANNTWSKTNRYHIVNGRNCPHPLRTESPANPPGTTYPAGGLRPSHSLSENVLSVEATRFDPEGQSRQVGPDAKPSRSKTPAARRTASELVVDSGKRVPNHAPRPPKSPPWRLVAAHFMGQWSEMIETTPAGYHLRDVRAADTLGHFQRYLNAHFFGKDALTPKTVDAVKLLVKQFVEDAYAGRVRIKPGQTAWMCFTGAWGRASVKPDEDDVYKEYFK